MGRSRGGTRHRAERTRRRIDAGRRICGRARHRHRQFHRRRSRRRGGLGRTDDAKHRANFDLGAFGHCDRRQHAGGGRVDLHRHLVRFELDQWIVEGNCLALLGRWSDALGIYNGAVVTLTQLVERGAQAELGELAQKEAEELLENGARWLGEPDVPRHVVVSPSTPEGLRDLAEREQADVIVSTYRRCGFQLERHADLETGGAWWRTLLLRRE